MTSSVFCHAAVWWSSVDVNFYGMAIFFSFICRLHVTTSSNYDYISGAAVCNELLGQMLQIDIAIMTGWFANKHQYNILRHVYIPLTFISSAFSGGCPLPAADCFITFVTLVLRAEICVSPLKNMKKWNRLSINNSGEWT